MKTVLIADDSTFMRTLLKNRLSRSGYITVAEAKDGAEAIKKYEQHSPDIVLMDITMPNVNGLTALDKIIEVDPKAKVIMCSAIGQQSIIIEAIQKGAKDFIVKPFFENMISILDNIND